MIAVDQPVKYGSKRIAKTRALLMVFKGPTTDDPSPNKIWIFCAGNERHYHADTGICVHVEAMSYQLKEWWRQRARFMPFGQRDHEYVKLPRPDLSKPPVRIDIQNLKEVSKP